MERQFFCSVCTRSFKAEPEKDGAGQCPHCKTLVAGVDPKFKPPAGRAIQWHAATRSWLVWDDAKKEYVHPEHPIDEPPPSPAGFKTPPEFPPAADLGPTAGDLPSPPVVRQVAGSPGSGKPGRPDGDFIPAVPRTEQAGTPEVKPTKTAEELAAELAIVTADRTFHFNGMVKVARQRDEARAEYDVLAEVHAQKLAELNAIIVAKNEELTKWQTIHRATLDALNATGFFEDDVGGTVEAIKSMARGLMISNADRDEAIAKANQLQQQVGSLKESLADLDKARDAGFREAELQSRPAAGLRAELDAERALRLTVEDRREAAESRLRLAKDSLVATGYFKAHQVDDDIAPRIGEFAIAMQQKLERLDKINADASKAGIDLTEEYEKLLSVNATIRDEERRACAETCKAVALKITLSGFVAVWMLDEFARSVMNRGHGQVFNPPATTEKTSG